MVSLLLSEGVEINLFTGSFPILGITNLENTDF